MLPDEDSPLLFGIDQDSDKAILDPIVFEEYSCEENELENTVVYHSCAVTLAMKKPLEEEETLLEDGTIETSNVALKEHLLG